MADEGAADAPRVPDEPDIIAGFRLTGRFTAEVELGSPGSFDQVIASVVAAKKRCVAETEPGARDIWFAALRRAALPGDLWQGAGPGRMSIAAPQELVQAGRPMVMTAVRLEYRDRPGQDFELVYTYRTD